jgi:hypothetical protein
LLTRPTQRPIQPFKSSLPYELISIDLSMITKPAPPLRSSKSYETISVDDN